MKKPTLYNGKAMACLLFLLFVLINACKKDHLLPKKVANTFPDKIRSIPYSQFIGAIDLNSTGSLKTVLSGQKAKLMSTQSLSGTLDLEMDSVKRLTLGDTISYVIAIKPQTPRATTFQNLTIQVVNTKTTAFLSTYYPEKEWIDNWRKQLPTKFKGSIVFNKIYLEDISLNERMKTTQSGERDGGLKDKLLATVSGNSGDRNVISLAPGECEIYDVVTVVAYPCSTGDMPGHCPWENDGGLTMGMLDYLPGYRFDRTTVINCAMPNLPSDGGGTGGGGGSGGSTTPNPPGTYNPCDGTPQPVGPGGISFERGTRLMVAAPTDCDELPGPPVTTTTQTPQQYLMNHLDLNAAELNFVNNPSHGESVVELSKYLIKNGLSITNTDFIHWAIGHISEDYSRFNQAFKDLLNGVYNEYSPIYIPANFDISYPQEYFDTENSYDALTLELIQEGLTNTDPIPEAYYKNGTRIDMAPATPLNGRRTALGFPSNHRYFWKELMKLRPEMFDADNRTRIADGRSPVANDQWIKHNPTHKAYKNLPLRHHHEGQGRWAYAIPEKVHQKWNSILHSIKAGKFPKLKGTMNSLAGGMQIFSLLVDFNTGNPDAWLNWFGPVDQVGKVYKQPLSGDYFVITKQTKYMNSSGEVIRAKVTYDVYADYIWDADEQKYMGVLKLGTFTENVDLNNRWSTDPVWEPKGL